MSPARKPEKGGEEEDPLDKVHVFTVRDEQQPSLATRGRRSVAPQFVRRLTETPGIEKRRSRPSRGITAGSLIAQEFKLLEVDGPAASLMGKIQRNSLTGKCFMDDVPDDMDFTLVDLKERDHESLSWSAPEMGKDMYFCTVFPLIARTWLYHELHRSDVAGHFTEYSGSIRSRLSYALSLKVNDSHQCGCFGAGSPAKILAPMLFSTGLAEDFASLIVVFLAFVISLNMSAYCNNLNFYRAGRLLTFPIRLLVLAWNALALMDVSTKIQEGKYHIIFAVLANICLCGYDLLEDFSAWYSVNQETSWEVVSLLPGKIMACRQVLTTEHISKATTHKINYLREISGYEKRDNIVLIAEIHGLLCILNPLSAEESDKLGKWCRLTRDPLRTYCTRTFTNSNPTADCFDDMGMLKVADGGQTAKREWMIQIINQLEMRNVDQKNKAQENSVSESPRNPVLDKMLKGFRFGPILTPGDFEKNRKTLLGIELMDEAATMKSIAWVNEQRKRAEDPEHYAKRNLKRKTSSKLRT